MSQALHGTAADRWRSADALTAGVDHETGQAGEPTTGTRTLAEVGGVEVGVWEIAPGTATDVEADEVFVVVSGRGEVRFEDGSVLPLAPGTVVRLTDGDRTTWTITETLRKIYVV